MGRAAARRRVATVASRDQIQAALVGTLELHTPTLGQVVDAISAKFPNQVRVDWNGLKAHQLSAGTRLPFVAYCSDASAGTNGS